MSMENEIKNNDIKETISQNIIKYRKKLGLTQLELAEKLNYSDKTLSKWERGESIPDIVTLKQLADIFNISVDMLISNENSTQIINKSEERKKLSKRNITSISLLSVGLVWLLATSVFVVLKILQINLIAINFSLWLCFIYAIPVSAIILLIFSCIWGNRLYQFFSTSLLLWGLAISVHLSLLNCEDIYLVYFVTIPLQIMEFIFFIILKKHKKNITV